MTDDGLQVDPYKHYVKLGRTDLNVCRIGIGGGSGLSSYDLDYAIERGINYLFYSSDLHPVSYGRGRSALRRYCIDLLAKWRAGGEFIAQRSPFALHMRTADAWAYYERYITLEKDSLPKDSTRTLSTVIN